jgi:hypothetical protein
MHPRFKNGLIPETAAGRAIQPAFAEVFHSLHRLEDMDGGLKWFRVWKKFGAVGGALALRSRTTRR